MSNLVYIGAMNRKIDLKQLPKKEHWAAEVADMIIAAHPDEEIYTCAAGISPSGTVHFGNFRDVITAHMVREALVAKGKNARLIFSWDNFDRFRKVPANVSKDFEQYIGMPLSKIPSPVDDGLASYAEHFQKPFEDAMGRLGIEIEYLNQTQLYESGQYDDEIIHALKNRDKIADVLLGFMSDKAKGEKGIDPIQYKENYYPISVYSRFTGKDITKVLDYDGDSTITYLCVETKKEDTIDITTDHLVKLAWKPDWGMRWKYENVHFEPAGHDHASPGGSYDSSAAICAGVYDALPPFFVEYKFVGIQGLGVKMSGSKGNAVSPAELLDIYEPELLRWLYERKQPNQEFQLAFNSEIYRQYEEFDVERDADAIPFRQVVGFGQIVQWDIEKLKTMLAGLELSYSDASIATRLPLAQNWLTKYNPEEVVALNKEVNAEYVATMSDEHIEQVRKLREELLNREQADVAELEVLVYDIPKRSDLDEKELRKEQRAFFKNVYNLLIGKNAGPRLGTFLWAADRDRVLTLLKI